MKLQAQTVAKAAEKDGKEGESKAAKSPASAKDSSAPLKSGEDSTHKNGAAPAVEAAGELSMEDDLQLQKAVELLKTWKIFKELRPA